MSQSLPETEEEMLKIVGVTKANFEKYGKQLLEITQEAAANKFGKYYIKQHTILYIYSNYKVNYLNSLKEKRQIQLNCTKQADLKLRLIKMNTFINFNQNKVK